MKVFRWLALASLLLTATVASAGMIHPSLQAQLDRTGPSTPISAIITLADQAPIAQLNADLKARSASRQERHAEVIRALREAAARSQQPLKDKLEAGILAGTVQGYTAYWISNVIVVQATKEEILSLARREDISIIESNFKAELIEPIARSPQPTDPDGLDQLRAIGMAPGIRALRAPEVWRQLGITGQGRLLANLDTGVDGNHAALRTRWRGYQGAEPWQECWLDVLGSGTQSPNDGYGHGTHVMGTMTGLAPNDTIGVSPASKWIACNAINQGVSQAFDQDIITAYQWFADPDGNPNTVDDVPDVVQNSWRINEGFGGSPPYTDCDTRWWAVLDNAAAAGVCVTWSAGNEGPGAQTIGSPSDRATTLTEAFSVGAVDATNYSWPYPIASFSSRGPSGCNVPAPQKIKPEVSAPGVDVYSSVPGGGYQLMSGTSMAGPHVAGIVGLLREANPDLDPDTIKNILMDTARDEGTAGEDNTYGWGFVDAFEAVQQAMVGYGSVQGYIRNGSWNNTPIQGAAVRIVERGTVVYSDATGLYRAVAPAGIYHLEVTHPSFEMETAVVVVTADQVTPQDFSMTDIAGPAISNTSQPGTTTDTVGPYAISATITDYSTVASARLYYRINNGGWSSVAMTGMGSTYTGAIPGVPAGTQIDYYVWAQDGVGISATDPANAPNGYYSLYITTVMFFDNVEAAGGWTIGAAGDNATSGIWVQADPVGTVYNGQVIQPEDDHTPAPGVQCFVTANDTPGDPAGEADVDGGCTTLLSPVFDLSTADMAFVSYYRWFGEGGLSADDQFEVDVTNNGTTWVAIDIVPDNAAAWNKVTKNIESYVALTSQIQFRFRACDLNSGGLIEAGIDDFAIETFVPNPESAPEGAVLSGSALAQNEPNPASAGTLIRFRLSNPGQARMDIYNASGRLVRTLFDRPFTAGAHEILWDGNDDEGNAVGSGVYFYKLNSGGYEQSRRMTILR